MLLISLDSSLMPVKQPLVKTDLPMGSQVMREHKNIIPKLIS